MMNMIMLLVVMIILKYDYHYHLCRILFIHQYYSSLRFIIITTVIILGAVIKDNHYTLVSIHRYLSSFCNWLNIEQYHHLLLVWYLLQRTLLADSRTYKKQHLAAVHPYVCDFSVVLACVFFCTQYFSSHPKTCRTSTQNYRSAHHHLPILPSLH